MRKSDRSTGTRDPDGKNGIKAGGRFTNTAVPRFDGGGCWQQHLQIVQAIVKLNGWTDGTTALQLFPHLDGEALNVALLMPEEEREKWEGLSQGLSDYYNSPERLCSGGDSRARFADQEWIWLRLPQNWESPQCGDLETWASMPVTR